MAFAAKNCNKKLYGGFNFGKFFFSFTLLSFVALFEMIIFFYSVIFIYISLRIVSANEEKISVENLGRLVVNGEELDCLIMGNTI